jgi:predicted DNA-binding protein (UPF0278 family)
MEELDALEYDLAAEAESGEVPSYLQVCYVYIYIPWTTVYTSWTTIYTPWTTIHTPWTTVYTSWTVVHTPCNIYYKIYASLFLHNVATVVPIIENGLVIKYV